jgi:undecaprenyl diphosphate synthase
MLDTIRSKITPQHVTIIMDGNGRWAKKRGLPRSAGHKEGLKTVKMVVKKCAELGVKVLSLFAFGQENWQRPDDEVGFLMELFIKALHEEVPELHEKSLRLRFIGDRSAFSEELHKCIDMAEQLTKNNTGMQLVLAMNYSGQWDITQAVQQLVTEFEEKKFSVADITSTQIEQRLATQDLIGPDLFIRTSGEKRISNFFLWQLAYTELFFCDENWPEFSQERLEQAIQWYSQRERRYGKISGQMMTGIENA